MYRFERSESAGQGLLRVVAEALDRACAHLTGDDAQPSERIHDARKRLKEARAALRLGRFALGARYAIEMRVLRSAGRALAEARDAEALVEAIRGLNDEAGAQEEKDALDQVERIASEARDRIVAGIFPGGAELVARQLHAVRARMPQWVLHVGGFRTFAKGLERSARAGRRAFENAVATRDAEDLHRWRRRVKDIWYQVQLVEPAWESVLKAHRKELRDLSRLLGTRHDLDNLAAALRTPILDSLITQRREDLTRDAIALGARIHAEPPRQWGRRIESCWTAWRAATVR